MVFFSESYQLKKNIPFLLFSKILRYMSVSRNGVYKIYDHMHVAFPRIIPRIMPPNHTRESYHESYPWFWKGRAKHTPKHTPETYLRNIPRIIPPDATRFAGHGIFGKGHIEIEDTADEKVLFPKTSAIRSRIILVYLHWKGYLPTKTNIAPGNGGFVRWVSFWGKRHSLRCDGVYLCQEQVAFEDFRSLFQQLESGHPQPSKWWGSMARGK